MNVLFYDAMQDSDAPKELISSSLADTYKYTPDLTVNFGRPCKINAAGIGNTDATTVRVTAITDWTAATMPGSEYWYDVTYGNGKFVAVTHGSDKAAWSADGINWTATTMPGSEYWRDVTYGNGKFVAVAHDSNKAVWSADGINWTAATMPSSEYWYDIAYGTGKFLAVSYDSNKAVWSLFASHDIAVSDNGLYLLPDEMEVNRVNIQCDGTCIGRLALGKAVNLCTSIPKEPAFVSTNKPRVTLSGQVIDGLGGYNYRRVSLDTRYKIDRDKMDEIIKGFPALSRGLPLFVSFEEEAARLPFRRLYCNDTNQQELGFEGGVMKPLFSRKWVFEERF
jgi:hypothetical protein